MPVRVRKRFSAASKAESGLEETMCRCQSPPKRFFMKARHWDAVVRYGCNASRRVKAAKDFCHWFQVNGSDKESVRQLASKESSCK